jgi:hypothetical protein
MHGQSIGDLFRSFERLEQSIADQAPVVPGGAYPRSKFYPPIAGPAVEALHV